MFEIIFFRYASGECPVIEFIENLDNVKQQDKIYAWIKLLEEKGNQLVRPHADYAQDGIYELRVNRYRIFYFFDNKKIILTNAIIKKTDKLPQKEIDIAKKLRKEYHAKRK